MATAEQIKSLIKAHYEGNNDAFKSIALQIAAREALQNHPSIAKELRTAIDKGILNQGSKIIHINPMLSELVLQCEPQYTLATIILKEHQKAQIERIIAEYFQRDVIRRHGLTNRRKILLTGLPGTGKTITSEVLANALHLPLYSVFMDKLITKFLGETSARVRQIFDLIAAHPGVYMFDEFDALGSDRSREDDVGEMRRALNTFLQYIERDDSDSIIVAATNNERLLDNALFRRFDDIIRYELPTAQEIKDLIQIRLNDFLPKDQDQIFDLAERIGGISHAEVVKACDDALKEAIMAGADSVSVSKLEQFMSYHKRFADMKAVS